MKKYYKLLVAFLSVATIIFVAGSCEKDFRPVTPPAPVPVSPVPTGSFSEGFDNVSDLTSKGWMFKNNSDPIGEAVAIHIGQNVEEATDEPAKHLVRKRDNLGQRRVLVQT